MVIMEINDKKKIEMSEYAEKVLRYAGKLMSLLEEGGEYGERDNYRRDHEDDDWRYGERRRYMR